jgi:hypothetical protein
MENMVLRKNILLTLVMKLPIFSLILITIFLSFGIAYIGFYSPPVFATDSIQDQRMKLVEIVKNQIESCVNQQTSDDLQKALNLIQKGLEPEFWDEEETHLNKTNGGEFFNNDKKTVKILLRIIDTNNESSDFDSELIQTIKTIVQIDKKIAKESILTISDLDSNYQLAKREKANKIFTKANNELELNNFVHSIKLYKKTWDYVHEKSNPMFDDVTENSGIQFEHYRGQGMPIGGGTAIIDFNNDGLLDIYITNSDGPNALYRNNGNLIFEDIAQKAGVEDILGDGNGVCFADFDNDGDADFFLSNYGTSKLFSNNGDETFTDVTSLAGVNDFDKKFRSMGCTWGDYDKDGDLDLIVVRHVTEIKTRFGISYMGTESLRPLSLYTNNGNGTFSDDTIFLGDPYEKIGNVKGASFQPIFIDYDNDGDSDIYVVNDFGTFLQPNVLWKNIGSGDDGKWVFEDISESSGSNVGLNGMGVAVGDFDSNGFFDFYITNIGKNVLLKNVNGKFLDVSQQAGVEREKLSPYELSVTWGTMFFDFDNDGFLDIYLVAGHLDVIYSSVKQPNALFRNNGDGTFSDISDISGTDDPSIGRGGVFGDFNNDGCLDIFLVNMGTNDGTPGKPKLFENNCESTNNWIIIKTIGNKSNQDGIGTRITVTTSNGEQIREVTSGSGQMSQNMLPVHFGLANSENVDIAIQWPSGKKQTFDDIPSNQIITISEP